MMGLCPLHNAFYMLTLYADALTAVSYKLFRIPAGLH